MRNLHWHSDQPRQLTRKERGAQERIAPASGGVLLPLSCTVTDHPQQQRTSTLRLYHDARPSSPAAILLVRARGGLEPGHPRGLCSWAEPAAVAGLRAGFMLLRAGASCAENGCRQSEVGAMPDGRKSRAR